MKYKIIIFMLVLSLFLISACAQTTAPIVEKQIEPVGVDVVRETTTKKTVEEEEIKEEPEEVEEVSSEVNQLLSLSKEKVQSISYKYKGPETKGFFYEFFVKGNKIKYVMDPTHKDVNIDEDAYDTIYVNKESKTALAYCDNKRCKVKGKKAVLDYDDSYIPTALDWLDNMESAEKIGEELIGMRNIWKLSANNITIWVDTFFGVPLQAESEGQIYQFQKMTFNQVKDGDVSPKG